MKVIEPGHIYEFEALDKKDQSEPNPRIVFVNREAGHEHSGTQTQDVLRALIDRTMHCHNCLPHDVNAKIIHHLRLALVLHESRALERKTEKGYIQPEHIMTGSDGHFTLLPK